MDRLQTSSISRLFGYVVRSLFLDLISTRPADVVLREEAIQCINA